MTLSLPRREMFVRGQRVLEVIGPVPEFAAAMPETHRGFSQSR